MHRPDNGKKVKTMDNVLSLQLLTGARPIDGCANSSVSCPSNVSCQSHQSGPGSSAGANLDVNW